MSAKAYHMLIIACMAKRDNVRTEKKEHIKGTTSPFRLDKDIISRTRTGGNRYAIHKEDLQSRKDKRV